MASLFSVLDAHKTSRLGHSTQKTPGTEISEFHRTRDLSTLQDGASAGLTLDEARQLMVHLWEMGTDLIIRTYTLYIDGNGYHLSYRSPMLSVVERG